MLFPIYCCLARRCSIFYFLFNLSKIYSDIITEREKGLLGQKKEQEMRIQNLSEDILLVELPSKGQKIAHELKAINETISGKSDRDVIIDFSKVEIINSSNISNLLIMHNLLHDSGHRLILCDVATVTKCIFVVAGLDKVFEFADDQPAALAAIQHAG